ncbi:hypothetical protein LWI28_002984 [Acer negundo]|uniref:Uncharacterized protein n=1 Tax=Acer negundo TaxID=4023 RepID=A0AAD5J2K1_ACENE|nr:hypothetical protein LWI28_002984 [Acer negundo]
MNEVEKDLGSKYGPYVELLKRCVFKNVAGANGKVLPNPVRRERVIHATRYWGITVKGRMCLLGRGLGSRLSNVQDKWNLEVEVAKVIEKGVELGHIRFMSAGDGRRNLGEDYGSQNEFWSLSQEVTNVIKMGVALGLDFNGEEDVIGEEVARRVTEDDES